MTGSSIHTNHRCSYTLQPFRLAGDGSAPAQRGPKKLAAAAKASRRAVELVNILYDKGLDNFVSVLDAQRALTEVEDQLATSETA